MVFDQIFAQIPDEPFEAITEICDRYLQHECALEGDDQYQSYAEIHDFREVLPLLGVETE